MAQITDLKVPSKTSELTNDSGFLTKHQDLSAYAKTSYVDGEINDLKQMGVQQVPLYASKIEECTDTSKLYVLPDGFIYAYMTVTEESSGATYTNVLPTAIGTDGKPFGGGKGYMTGYRFNSSLTLKESSGNCCTGLIKCKANDVIRVKNIKLSQSLNGYVHFWTSSFTNATVAYYEGTASDGTVIGSDGIMQFTIKNSSAIAYFSISTGTIDDTTIITINQEIKEGTTTTTTTKWVNTGHAFVPNENYDEIVAELQRVTTSHTQELNDLREQIENGTSEPETDSLSLIKNWDAPIYDANISVFELTSEKTGKTGVTNTPSTIYALYDSLMAKHPDYISKTDLGLCSDGVNHVYRYDFKEREPRHESGATYSETKTKAILMSGVHFEWAGIYSLYYALEEIAENPALYDLRRNTHFIVVPVSNPYCTIAENYNASIGVLNANGVQIHRNFEVDFLYPADSGYISAGNRNHGGTAPLSEVETQYIDNIMKNNTDSAFFMTCHNFDSDAQWGVNFIWSSTATKYMCNMGFRLVDKMSNAWMKSHPELKQGVDSLKTSNVADGDYRLGFAGLSTSAGTETKQATKYGIQATNVEVCATFLTHGTKANPEPSMSSFTLSRGCETYINFLLMACGLYDYKDKKEYFKG